MSNKAKRKEIVRNFKPGGRMIFSIFQAMLQIIQKTLPPMTFRSFRPTSVPFRIPKQAFPLDWKRFCQHSLKHKGSLWLHQRLNLKTKGGKTVEGWTYWYYKISFWWEFKLSFRFSVIRKAQCKGLEVFLDITYTFERFPSFPANRKRLIIQCFSQRLRG